MAYATSLPLKSLYRQTLPMLVGLFAIMGSQFIDSVFIAQLGPQSLAALGFSVPIYQLIVGIQVGIGIAATACISIAIGERKHSYAKNLSAIVLGLGCLVVSLLILLLWFYQQSIFSVLGAKPNVIRLLPKFWAPWLLSCWLGAFLYFGYSICRAFGQTLVPGKVMILTSVINVLLDPVFIFTFKMGLAGAAWATCIAFFIGLVVIFKSIFKQGYMALPKNAEVISAGTSAIAKFTAPALLSQFIPPLSAFFVTIIVASYGILAVGVWGMVSRIEYVLIVLVLAVTMALPPMIGKLKGEQRHTEILKLIKTAIFSIIAFQLALAILMMIFVSPITSLLSGEEDVKSLLMQYFFLIPISYTGLGVCMISVSACNAIGAPSAALHASLLRLFVCYLPLVWLGSEMYGLMGLFIGASLGNILSGMVGWKMFLVQYHKLIEPRLCSVALNQANE